MESQKSPTIMLPTCLKSTLRKTPADGLLYISTNFWKVVHVPLPKENQLFPEVKIFTTRNCCEYLIVDPIWENGRQEFAIYDETMKISIIDLEKGYVKGHKTHHIPTKVKITPKIAFCYTYNRRILSVDERIFVNYDVDSNTYTCKTVGTLFNKQQVSILSASPYNFDVFAAGTRRGVILIMSLKNMSVLHQLRGHDSEIRSLAWNMLRQTITSQNKHLNVPNAVPKVTTPEISSSVDFAAPQTEDDLFDVYSYDHLENEFGTYADNAIIESDDECKGFNKLEIVEGNEKFDYVEACGNLKDVILQTVDANTTTTDIDQLCEKVENIIDEELPQTTTCQTDDFQNLRGQLTVQTSNLSNDSFPLDDEGVEDGSVSPAENVEPIPEYIDHILLASTSNEPKVWIWDAKTGSSVESFKLKAPHRNNTKMFSNLFWIDDNALLTNDDRITKWTLNYNEANKLVIKKLFKEYNFEQATAFVTGKPHKDDSSKATYVWIGEVDTLRCLEINASANVSELMIAPFISVTTQAIEISSLDSNLLAVTSNNYICILNLSQIKSNCVTGCLHVPIKSAVFSMDWHPERSNLLAVSTKEGRIGIVNINHKMQAPIWMKPHFSSTVYSISWGTIIDRATQTKQVVLFACAKQKIVYFPESGPNKYEPVILKIHANCPKTIKAHGKYLFIGGQDGFFYICDMHNNFQFLYGKSLGKNYIASIDANGDKVVVATMCRNVQLLDISRLDDVKIKTFSGHTDAVVTVKFNANGSKLVSSGYDQTVRIWDVNDVNDCQVFTMPGPTFGTVFSPLNPNIVICGGQNYVPVMFDITSEVKDLQVRFPTLRNQEAVDTVNVDKKKKKSKHSKRDKANALNRATSEEEEEVTSLVESLKEVQITPIRVNGHDEAQPAVVESQQPTVLYLCTKELNRDPLQILKRYISSLNDVTKSKNDVFYNERFFSSDNSLRELLNQEFQNNVTSTKSTSVGHLLLPQMTGRLREEIVQRLNAKTMTDEFLSLAPSVSYEFWRNCCKAYGMQLIEKGQILKAMAYLWSCHDINEMIEHLCDAKYFREAYAVAKLRKEVDDPVFGSILEQWAVHFENTGALEAAAMIFTVNRNYTKAKYALQKRKQPTAVHEAILQLLDELN